MSTCFTCAHEMSDICVQTWEVKCVWHSGCCLVYSRMDGYCAVPMSCEEDCLLAHFRYTYPRTSILHWLVTQCLSHIQEEIPKQIVVWIHHLNTFKLYFIWVVNYTFWHVFLWQSGFRSAANSSDNGGSIWRMGSSPSSYYIQTQQPH